MFAALLNRLSMNISHIQFYTIIYSFRYFNFLVLLTVCTKIYFSPAVLFNQWYAELVQVVKLLTCWGHTPSSWPTILSLSRLLLGH